MKNLLALLIASSLCLLYACGSDDEDPSNSNCDSVPAGLLGTWEETNVETVCSGGGGFNTPTSEDPFVLVINADGTYQSGLKSEIPDGLFSGTLCITGNLFIRDGSESQDTYQLTGGTLTIYEEGANDISTVPTGECRQITTYSKAAS